MEEWLIVGLGQGTMYGEAGTSCDRSKKGFKDIEASEPRMGTIYWGSKYEYIIEQVEMAVTPFSYSEN